MSRLFQVAPLIAPQNMPSIPAEAALSFLNQEWKELKLKNSDSPASVYFACSRRARHPAVRISHHTGASGQRAREDGLTP